MRTITFKPKGQPEALEYSEVNDNGLLQVGDVVVITEPTGKRGGVEIARVTQTMAITAKGRRFSRRYSSRFTELPRDTWEKRIFEAFRPIEEPEPLKDLKTSEDLPKDAAVVMLHTGKC